MEHTSLKNKRNLILYVFLIISLLPLTNIKALDKIKVIYYNVREGMALDTTQNKDLFVQWIKEQDPDIMAFCEMNRFTQKKLEETARRYGHPYAVLLRPYGYPTAITSKYPILNIRRELDNLHHGMLIVKTNGYNIVVTHLSPDKYWKRREEMELILKTIESSTSQKKWLIMGDLNSYSPLDYDHYTDGKMARALAAAAQRYKQHENLVDGDKLDFEVQQKILDFGFIDPIKILFPNKYISSAATKKYNHGDPNANTSRIDYIYISKDLKKNLISAEIIKDNFTDYLSDHYPVCIELKQ